LSFQMMQTGRCPTDELSLTNCAVVGEKELQFEQSLYSFVTHMSVSESVRCFFVYIHHNKPVFVL
uniref:Uncharacterized protein n=1 Tax=Seriola lalandi dorsalis TaxID=1841481 RepID=A0A3B4WZS8_SERLL